MVKIAKYDTVICGIKMFKSKLILIIDKVAEERKLSHRIKSEIEKQNKCVRKCKKGKIKMTTCEEIKREFDLRKRKENKRRVVEAIESRRRNEVTCPKCGFTSEVAFIMACFSRSFMDWQFLFRGIGTYRGCRNCFYDYSICQNKVFSRDLCRIFNYKFRNTNEIFFDNVKSDLYEIVCLPDSTEYKYPDEHIRKPRNEKTECEHSGDVQCGDVLYCFVCGTVVCDKNCVGCGAGTPTKLLCLESNKRR